MRRLAVALAVLVVVGIVGDFAARAYAQSQAAAALQARLELSRRPEVSLGGFPFLFHVATGNFGSVTITDENLTAGKLPLRAVVLRLGDVRFSAGDLVSGRSTTVTSDSAEGTATLTGPGVTRALRDQGVNVTVRLADGAVHVSADGLPGELTAAVRLDGQSLVFTPKGLSLVSFRLDLGEIVPGIQYTGASVEGTVGVLRFSLRERRLVI